MVHCPACGTEVPEGARFCQNCGAEIAAGAAAISDTAIATTTAAYTAMEHPPPVSSSAVPPPPPYAYPPPPYPVIPGQPYVTARSGKAVAGMWLGIASIPAMILSWVGIIIGVLGIIFSLLGLSEIRRRERSGIPIASNTFRRQAIVGVLCSIIGIAASTAFLVYILSHLGDFGIKLTP